MTQQSLFAKGEWWEDDWQGMPDFKQDDLSPIKQIIVSFATWDDMHKFAELVRQTVTPDTQSIWYPKAEIETYSDKRYKDEPDIPSIHSD